MEAAVGGASTDGVAFGHAAGKTRGAGPGDAARRASSRLDRRTATASHGAPAPAPTVTKHGRQASRGLSRSLVIRLSGTVSVASPDQLSLSDRAFCAWCVCVRTRPTRYVSCSVRARLSARVAGTSGVFRIVLASRLDHRRRFSGRDFFLFLLPSSGPEDFRAFGPYPARAHPAA